jgi:hypothetical protein
VSRPDSALPGDQQETTSLPVESARQCDSRPEFSPLWGLALILGEIAVRIERRRAEEHEDAA